MSPDFLSQTATEVAEHIRDRKIAAIELTMLALDRAEHIAGHNPFITLDRQGALTRAREIDASLNRGETHGVLAGVPVAIKDNIEVAGLPNTAGTPALKRNIPANDAVVVARLKAAGAVIIGKTNLHEMAFGITNVNPHFGDVSNPFASEMFAGGSSGGSAVAVSTCAVFAALGTDTGGSVRIPAALCGTFGYRPSTGRYPMTGVTPLSRSRDVIGPISRSVADLIAIDHILRGAPSRPTPALPSVIRLGVPRRHFFEQLDDDLGTVIEAALATIGSGDFQLVDVDIDDIQKFDGYTNFVLSTYEARKEIANYLHGLPLPLTLDELISQLGSEDIRDLFGKFIVGPGAPSAAAYSVAVDNHLPAIRRGFGAYFADHHLDGCLFPTTPAPARPRKDALAGVLINGERRATFDTYTRNTRLTTFAGIPGITIPVGQTPAGLPVGLEVSGPRGSDTRTLAIAARIEQLFGTPPMPKTGGANLC